MDLLGRSTARGEFERFSATYADGLLRTAYLMTGDRGDAEDVVQECMLLVARKWPRVKTMDHPGAYARRVMVGLVLDGGRQRSRRRLELATAVPIDSVAQTVAATARVHARTDLVRALGELSPRARAVLVLRYFCDLPEAEVADLLGCSVGTVKSNASRALERLRAALGDLEPNARPAQQPESARRTRR